MFERKIEETISFLLRDTIAEQETVTSRQIFASDIPVALKRLFEQDIDLWITEEKDRLFNSPHFRYDEQDVQELFEQIIARTHEYAVFGKEEYGQALDKNVKLLFNHVCRPQWTLVKYFFADRENASADAIIDGLKYFHYYEYYRVILSEYFQKKDISVMNAKKFGELLEYIDQEVVRNFDSRKVAHLAQPVFEAFSIGSSVEEKFAPVEALTLFYDDKNLRSIVERLEREKEKRESITMHDLVMLISEVDYAMSFDISEIVHEQIHGSSVMKPERKATAGKDFDVPKIDQSVEPDERRKDIGEEEGDLDFIITDEENSVVSHASDEESIDTVIEQDETDTDIDDDLDLTIEQAEEDAAVSDAESYEDEFALQDDDGDQDIDELDSPDALQTDNGEYRFSLEEEIPVGDESIEEDEFAGGETGFETSVDDELSLQEDLTEEVSSIDLAERMEERDSIPEMSLDDMDELARSMGEESDDEIVLDTEEFDDEMREEQQEPDIDDDSVPDVSLEDEADEELDIDWEKEAEDLPEVDIDEEEEEAVVADDSIPGISFTEDEKTGVKLTGIIGKSGMLDQQHYSDLDRAALEDEPREKIFLFHTAIDELKPASLTMEANGINMLPEGFDYYAGGHVHVVRDADYSDEGYENVVYPGPLFPTNFSELETLSNGGFYIYDEGDLRREPIRLRNVVSVSLDVDQDNPEEVNESLTTLLSEKDVTDAIVTIRVSGELVGGRTSDIGFGKIHDRLLERGAFAVLKNTNALQTESFKADVDEERSHETIENELIREYAGQVDHVFDDEVSVVHELLQTLSEEKQDGETNTDYDDRMIDEARSVLTAHVEAGDNEGADDVSEATGLDAFIEES